MASEAVTSLDPSGYGREDDAVAGYSRVLLTYVGALGLTLGALRLAGRRGSSLSIRDVAIFGVATHHVAHVLAKDPVTSPVRAPFTRFEGAQGPAELKESVRGTGLQKALGELLTCPFCLGQWVATGFTVGAVAAPRLTRQVADICAIASISNGLQLLRAKLQG